LKRIEQDASYASAKSIEHPDWYVSRFEYHHGSLVVVNKKGDKKLVFDCNHEILLGNVTRAIWQLNPDVTKELIRGYRLAFEAGLLK
jgi:hypothetical protein